METANVTQGSVTVQQTVAREKAAGIIPIFSASLGPMVGLLVWFLPLGLEPAGQQALAVVAFMIIYWMMEPVDHAVTGLIGCYLFWALGIVQISVAFSGFASRTPWFIFGGLLVAQGVASTGLAKRLGYRILHYMGMSYSRLLLGVIILSFLLTLFVPGGPARVALVASMLIAVFTILGIEKKSKVAKGIFLGMSAAAVVSEKTVLSGSVGILAHGIVKEQTGIDIPWSQWFVAFLPISVLTVPIYWVTLRWLYPADKMAPVSGDSFDKTVREIGPLSAAEKKLLGTIVVTLGLWSTDFIHHIDPAIVGLGAGLFLVLPRVGVLDTKAITSINFMVVLFSAGAVSMTHVLAETQALGVFRNFIAGHLENGLSNAFTSSLTLYWGCVLSHFLFPNNQAFIGASLPLLLAATQDLGYSPAVIGMVWQFAGGGVLFAYQSVIWLIGYSYGYFDSRDLLKVGAVTLVIQSALVAAVVPLYWPLIGLSWVQ